MLRQTRSDKETQELAAQIVSQRTCNVIALYGELGAGKTTFAKGALLSLGIRAPVQSPTFTYQRVYSGENGTVYHFDCYRITGPDELLMHDLGEAWSDPNGITIIEWADRVSSILPKHHLDVHMSYVDDTTREIHLSKTVVQEDVEALVREFHTPLHVQRHSKVVSDFAVSLAEKLVKKGESINIPLVKYAGALHDLVRVVDFREFIPDSFPDPYTQKDLEVWHAIRKEYGGKHHAIAGAEILLERGFDDVSMIVRKHRYMQIVEGFLNWEEKLVYYGDKRAKHDSIVPLLERLEDGRRRNLPNTPFTEKSRAVQEKVVALEQEIFRKLGGPV